MAGLETIALIAGLGGAALQTVGAISQGRQQEAQYRYQQKQAEQAADEAVASGQRRARERYRQGALAMSDQRAGVAASGGSTAEGSVINVMSETAKQTDLGARTEIYKADQQSRGYQDAATTAGVNASNTMPNAYLNAAGTLFSGASSLYTRFGAPNASAPASGPIQTPYG